MRETATHHLNPVPIWIQNECKKVHLSLRETLLERHAEPLEAGARRLDVVHSDRDVAEPARVGIAGMVGVPLDQLRTVIVRELEDT